MGKNKHPVECSCQRTEREKQEALISQQKHSDLVRRLKAEGFSDPAMLDWKFENDNGRSPQMCHAHRYVEQWQTMRAENLGLFLWGGVGTGKSFLAGCIANALIEQEVPVRMTNFARILNELNSSFSGRNDIVDKFCRYPLLIIDDFGMERGTEYALEQIYNIVDSRYRSRKPLIVTTNLTLNEIQHPQDTALPNHVFGAGSRISGNVDFCRIIKATSRFFQILSFCMIHAFLRKSTPLTG
jgi:DNA replication protein DnaC